jgi:peptidoglycan/LPS O-acetylase OafA/YrhL
MVISVDELAPFGKTGATALFYLLIAGIAWFIPKLNGSTLFAFVPFMLAFCGGGASAPHVKNLDHPRSYSKVMLALAITAICFDLLGSMAIGMAVPKDPKIVLALFTHMVNCLLQLVFLVIYCKRLWKSCSPAESSVNLVTGLLVLTKGCMKLQGKATCLNSLPRPLSMVCQSES